MPGHQLTRNDLQFPYSSRAQRGDDPRLRGTPDNDLLDVDEEYEVLAFINNFQNTHSRDGKPLTKDDALHVEKLLHRKPGNVRSHQKVTEWVLANWNAV